MRCTTREMGSLLTFFIIALSGAPRHARANPSLNVASVRQEIGVKGPKRVVNDYFNNQRRWEQLIGKISTGQTPWLGVAAQLKAGSDAGASQGLNFAVGRALPNNPRGVLKLLGPDFKLEDVCVSPFIEQPADVGARFVARARQALARQLSGPLSEKAKACLDNLTAN